MPLPEFNELGDLPAGVYRASWHEVVEHFGGGTQQLRCTRHIHD